MNKLYIFNEKDNRQFRELEFNPDAEAGGQWIERIYSYAFVLWVHTHAISNESFCELIDERATTYLYDKGTKEFDDIEAFIKNPSVNQPTWINRNPTSLLSATYRAYSNCINCALREYCDAKRYAEGKPSIAQEPNHTCDMFMYDAYCQLYLPLEEDN